MQIGVSCFYPDVIKITIRNNVHLCYIFLSCCVGSVKECYLAALSHLLFAVPEQVLLTEIPPVGAASRSSTGALLPLQLWTKALLHCILYV